MTDRVVTFGEVMLRLKTPGYERLGQGPHLEMTFGGGEANVAASLTRFGWNASLVSALPDNEVGEALIRGLRTEGVDTSGCVRGHGRLGIYFLEAGAAQRAANVVYDREHSLFSETGPDAYDWDAIFDGASWFHMSGISAAVSQAAADASLEAVKQARSRGVKVSLDFNYRSKLWQYGKDPREIMPALVECANTVIAGIEDIRTMLSLDVSDGGDEPRPMRFRRYVEALRKAYPNVGEVVCTMRESISASHNRLGACMATVGDFHVARTYDITQIVDRVGTGDAFVAGLIHGLHTWGAGPRAVEFATAAGCLKHSIPGDFNLVTLAEVEALMDGDGSGRVQR